LKVGDRVVVPFTIACGKCFFCQRGFFSGCERSNPNHEIAEKAWGHSAAGLFGYSHMLGGYSGGQAEYLRVPFADVGPIKVPAGLTDEQVLFLSDIFPTGYMAADFCNIQGGDTIAVWGCGPVGQFAIRSAFLPGALRTDVAPMRASHSPQHDAGCGGSANIAHKAARGSLPLPATGQQGEVFVDRDRDEPAVSRDHRHTAVEQSACDRCGIVTVSHFRGSRSPYDRSHRCAPRIGGVIPGEGFINLPLGLNAVGPQRKLA
jgi:hypothetical protein